MRIGTRLVKKKKISKPSVMMLLVLKKDITIRIYFKSHLINIKKN